MSSLLLGGVGVVALSPANAGAGQQAASPGAASGSDLESPAAGGATAGVAAGGAAALDSTPPRLLRIEWPVEMNLGTVYDLDVNGPTFVFDEPVDCSSVPHLSGRTILSAGTIKAYSKHVSDYYLVDAYGRFNVKESHQSIAVTGECSGNRVRIHPVADGRRPGGSFAAGEHTVVLVGGIKDLAGNTSPEGLSALAGPVGDIRTEAELEQLTGLRYNVHAVAGSLAVRGRIQMNPHHFTLITELSNKQDSDGKIRVRPDGFELDCSNMDLTRYLSLYYATYDDLLASKPMKPLAISRVACEAPHMSHLKPVLVITADIPPASAVKLRVDGNLSDKSANVTKGSGSYVELLQDVNGIPTPIPREFNYFMWKWPENLVRPQPECKEVTVDQVVTHYDHGSSSYSCHGEMILPYWDAGQTAHYMYDYGGYPLAVRGMCVDYSGPAYRGEDYEASMAAAEKKCVSSFAGVPASLKQDYREFWGADCQAGWWGAARNGDSYLSTGVAGVCIENPGKDNEYAVSYYNYEDRAKAKAACKGYWREAGPGFYRPNLDLSQPNPPPGTVQRVTVRSCPSSESNTGSVGTQLPPGQVCEGRKIEIDTTKGRWFNTPERRIPHPTQPGKFTLVKGIHTYWQNEPLIVRVKNNCQEGYYKLTFKGMNTDGPLPEFYKGYALTLQSEDQDAAGMVLPASDVLYGTTGAVVYLKKGDSEFRLMWRNDAYREKVYDANLQLNGVTMSFLPSYVPPTKLARAGREFCSMDGRFFPGSRSIWTDAAGQKVAYCFNDLKPGKYEVRITARNHGALPAGYNQFNVSVSGDGVSAVAAIPASADRSASGKVILDIRGGNRKIELVWTNAAGVSEELRAAFEIDAISLRRVGDSERSGVAAFLTGGGNTVPALAAAAVLSLLALAGFALRQRFAR